MKKLAALLALFFTVLVVAAAGDAVAELQKFQGNWTILSLIEKGKAVPAEELAILELHIEKNVLTVKEKGETVVQYNFKLDPTKTPRAIDFTHTIGENKGKTEFGIYAFDGKQLKMVLDEERKGRPTTFDGKETANYSVMTLKQK
ncbi:MAG: TIGR03067 domain-containing protein [Gemmataceae bacterium]|nr:TIGR03067 domain-containing protein [Gemmataceae bacterium]